MLVELATEGNGEVACCSTGDSIGGVQGFATVIGAPALADLHVLEARLHTEEDRVTPFQLFASINAHLNQHMCISTHTLTGSCGGNP